jgi:phytoene synthase
MIRTEHAIHSSYRLCRGVARRAGSNFYPSFLLLSKPKRRAMDALYSFTRYTDDLIDNPEPVEARREALVQWRASLETALSGNFDPTGIRPWLEGRRDRRLPADKMPGEVFLPALVDTVERFGIPVEHLMAVVDGVGMDLDRASYETFDELVTYCHRVASAVGLACIHVWGFRGNEAFEPARKCGVAFQVTNILRDLKEDAEQGRIYLPMEDFRGSGYSVEALAAGVVDDAFGRLMRLQIDRARQLYREGAELFDRLEPDGRRIFGMMTTVYHRLLERISHRPGRVFRGRVGLSRRQKLGIAARWMLLPARRSALP